MESNQDTMKTHKENHKNTMLYTENEGKHKKKKFENRELTDESFGIWKLDGDDSGETPKIKHR